MRTTIRIDDALYREIKARAAREGRTAAAVLEDAVRIGLVPAGQARPPYAVRPYGRGGLRPGVDMTSNAGLYEALDEDAPLDALR